MRRIEPRDAKKKVEESPKKVEKSKSQRGFSIRGNGSLLRRRPSEASHSTIVLRLMPNMDQIDVFDRLTQNEPKRKRFSTISKKLVEFRKTTKADELSR